jgi:hypothetical protein
LILSKIDKLNIAQFAESMYLKFIIKICVKTSITLQTVLIAELVLKRYPLFGDEEMIDASCIIP